MKSLRFNIIVIFIIVLIISIFAMTLIVFAINYKKNDFSLVDEQKNKVISFFQQHKSELNIIKNSLWEDKYSIREINSSGYLILDDNTTKYDYQISPIIKDIYSDGEKYNIRTMNYGFRTEKSLWIDFFYPQNNIEIDIVYSMTDLTNDSGMYSKLEDDWYLFVAGLS